MLFFIQVVAVVLAASGSAYYMLCLWSASVFASGRRAGSPAGAREEFTPSISILKPLCGADPALYEALRSHCLQDYPDYEIVFGVAGTADAAIAVVDRIRSEFPQLRIQLVQCPQILGNNRKVSNLAQMLPAAGHDYLLINDSDILAPRNYLREVIVPLADPNTGLVTAMYRGAVCGFFAKLEALGISTDFAGGVLAGRCLEGMRFALGSTLTISREMLARIGGFEPLLDYLADDYEMGARVAAAGSKVVLSTVIVETQLAHYDFSSFWKHQLRWARTIRGARPLSYPGLLVTYGWIWALLAFALVPDSQWLRLLLCATVVLRVAVAVSIGKGILKDPQIPRSLWLLPLRDLLAFIIWFAALVGNHIEWRGRRFKLKGGKLIPAD